MADKMKDATDRKLESLFASDAIADVGFSTRVEKRIQHQLWVDRLALPIAILVGGAIALKPMIALLIALSRLTTALPHNVISTIGGLASGNLPHLSTIVTGVILALAFVMVSAFLED